MAALPSGITSANDGEFVVNGGKVYVAEGGAWERVTGGGNASAGGPLEVGSTITWTSTVLPASGDWVLADGRRLSAAAYPEAYAFAQAAVAADGANALWTVRASDQTFTVPDLRSRFLYGAGARPFGQVGGAETVRLTAAQSGLPAHNHTLTPPSGAAINAAWGNQVTVSNLVGSTTGTNTALDASQAHENMPPYVAVGRIVRVRNTVQQGGTATSLSVLRPNIPWYNNGADGGAPNNSAITELRNSAGQSSRIIIPAAAVPQTFEVSFKGTFSADSANWSPFFIGTRVLRSSDGAFLAWAGQAYNNANPGGGMDWTTVVAEQDYTPPMNMQVELQPVCVFTSQYGGVYSRNPDASQFKATRVG